MGKKQQKMSKNRKNRYQQYEPEALVKAVEFYKTGSVSVSEAAQKFGVPAQTIRDRIQGNVRLNAKPGRKVLLSEEEEQVVAQHVDRLSRLGYRISNTLLAESTCQLAKTLERKTSGVRMSNDWVYGFIHRWEKQYPGVRSTCSQDRSKATETVTGVANQAYYRELAKVLEELDLQTKPESMFSLYMVDLSAEHKSPASLSELRSKTPTLASSGVTSLIACGSATGASLPPYLIFQGKELLPEMLTGKMENTGACVTETGYITSQLLAQYLEGHFLKHIGEAALPVVITYDGTLSHVDLSVVYLAQQRNIHLFPIPPHMARVFKPMDVSCFGPLKGTFFQECLAWLQEHSGQVIEQNNMCQLICKAYSKVMTSVNIKTGFDKMGIFPLSSRTEADRPVRSSKRHREDTRQVQGGYTDTCLEDGPRAEDQVAMNGSSHGPDPVAKKPRLETELEQFDKVFPEIVDALVTDRITKEVADAYNWFKEVLNYNVPHGKKNRGLFVVMSYKYLVPDAKPEDLHVARILGWCIELLQAFFLVADDVMDSSLTRRGKPCWYKKEGVGMEAVNDAVFLESCVYQLLRTYVRDKPYYVQIMELFHQVTHATITGQCLDMTVSPPEGTVDFARYTSVKYNAIVKWKTAFYSFYLPVAAAMYQAGISGEESHSYAESILLKMGHYFQIQDDYLDCYGDPAVTGKVGTDIEDNKCSWLVVTALQRASPEQRQTLQENYGSKETEKVARVKAVFAELELQQAYKEFEEKSYQEIIALIEKQDSSSTPIPRELFMALVNKIYKRSK